MNKYQNIEYIFTKEQLDIFVRQGYLETILLNKKLYYIKKGCSKLFLSNQKKTSHKEYYKN